MELNVWNLSDAVELISEFIDYYEEGEKIREQNETLEVYHNRLFGMDLVYEH